MPKVNITPQAVLLTSGHAATFEATDENQQPVQVTWTLSPPAIGSLATLPASIPAASVTYVAPTVTAAQTVAVIASNPQDSASATISLTPDAIAIVPAKVELRPGQEQKFVALIAGATVAGPSSSSIGARPDDAGVSRITWILSPPIGELKQSGTLGQEGLYKAVEVPDSTTVSVIAASEASGKQATAVVSLTSPPWAGRGVQLLGGYLLLVFTLVFLIVLLWPPALPSPETAKANRIEAEKTLEERTGDLQKKEADLHKAEANLHKAEAKLANAKAANDKKAPPSGNSAPPKTDQDSTTVEDAQAEKDTAYYVWTRAEKTQEFAETDLDKKRKIEEKVNNPDVKTRLVGDINRELDLLCLVLLSGCLGAFLHMSQSFSDYVGNRTIKSNWAWWYYFGPFIGAGLALVFYAALRGGVMAIATGSNATGSEINPFGLVSVGALVGMFSKAATMKLGEVFDTLFKSDKAKESKDKLNTTPPSQTGSTAVTGSSSTTAK